MNIYEVTNGQPASNVHENVSRPLSLRAITFLVVNRQLNYNHQNVIKLGCKRVLTA